MKKTIKILVEKLDNLNEKKDGTLQGGFSSIKGGYYATDLGTNTWPNSCTNSGNCTGSTNTGYGCTNSGTCFM